VEFTLSANLSAERAPAVAALAADIARGEEVAITLIDDAARERLIARLAERAGVDPAIATFAVGDPLNAGFTCGANRNTAMLHYAGRPP